MTRRRSKVAPASARPKPVLYEHTAHPGQLITRERRYLVMWPAAPGGWAQRRPLVVADERGLVAVDLSTAIGTGWHHARRPRAGKPPAAGVARDVHRSIVLTPGESGAIDRARGAQPFAAWVRGAALERVTRGGRPPLGAAKRSARVQIMVTPDVDDRITIAADAADLSRSDWGAAALERALEAVPTDPPAT